MRSHTDSTDDAAKRRCESAPCVEPLESRLCLSGVSFAVATPTVTVASSSSAASEHHLRHLRHLRQLHASNIVFVNSNDMGARTHQTGRTGHRPVIVVPVGTDPAAAVVPAGVAFVSTNDMGARTQPTGRTGHRPVIVVPVASSTSSSSANSTTMTSVAAPFPGIDAPFPGVGLPGTGLGNVFNTGIGIGSSTGVGTVGTGLGTTSGTM